MIPMIEPVLFCDPQSAKPVCFCSRCGGELYGEGQPCGRCLHREFLPLKELSRDYRAAAVPLRRRLRELRFLLAQTVGFEPTCRFTDKLISSQPRYDHFDTSAYFIRTF